MCNHLGPHSSGAPELDIQSHCRYSYSQSHHKVSRYNPPDLGQTQPKRERHKGSRAGFATQPALWRQSRCIGAGKRGHYERGLFTGEISKISDHSLESLENGRNLLSFPQSGGSLKLSKISKCSRISRQWAFLKRPIFQRPLFSEPDCRGKSQQ